MAAIFENVLVVLNNHPDDEVVFEGLSDFLKEDPEHRKLLFVHVPEDLDLPHIKFSKAGFSEKKVLSALENSLKNKISSEFGELNFDLIVMEGHPVHDLVEIVRKENIDLVIVSSHDDNEGGLNNGRFVRHSPCSVLILNRASKLKFDRVLVPVDCSDHSDLVLEKILLSEPLKKGSEVHFLNVYPRPTAFYETGMNFEDFARIAEQNAREEVDVFLQSGDLKVLNYKAEVVMDQGHNVAKTILDSAHKQGSDLVIIGSKGKTGVATLLLGSVTEKLLDLSEDVPILVIKDPAQEIKFLDAIKKV